MSCLSVVIPTYNRSSYLLRTLDSIWTDVGPGVHVIVVDDGSTDNTGEALRGLPIEYVNLPRRAGVAAARNAGLIAARTKYVTFIDSDDLVAPGGLKARLGWLKRHPDAFVVGGQIAGLIDEEGEEIDCNRDFLRLPRRLSLSHVLGADPIPTSIWPYIFDRQFLLKVGFFDIRLQMLEDWEYLIRVLQYCEIDVLEVPSILYRIHSENLSVTNKNGHIVGRPLHRAHAVLVAMQYGARIQSA